MSTEAGSFENPTVPETIDLDLLLSFRSQSLTEESEAGEEPLNPMGHDSSATVEPQAVLDKLTRLRQENTLSAQRYPSEAVRIVICACQVSGIRMLWIYLKIIGWTF